ncbi:MAG TPA: DivIVA domain-containing protein, partial [Acidimicrobiales bacterium]|nr:DivIVA domain-containing protein [Acidimicrobiales bacterium]
MEISSKELREVEFRTSLRGYDMTEVDEFLERVAVSVDEMSAEVTRAADRADRAERAASDRPAASSTASEDEDTLRRTLVLAQRTADLAIKEAQDAAAEILDNSRSEAEAAIARAEEAAKRMTNEAQQALMEEVSRLTKMRDELRKDVRTLTDLLETERGRIGDALSSALKWVEQSMSVSPQMESARSVPLSHEGDDAGDGVEAQVAEDAEAAAPATPPPAALHQHVASEGEPEYEPQD